MSLLILVGSASAAVAQQTQRMHAGLRGGGNFEYGDAAVGAHLTVPLGRYFEFYPSFDAYFPERGSRLGFNADLKYRIPTSTTVKFYSGAGVGMMRREVADIDQHHWGANVLGGIEHRASWVHPFLETRVMFYDRTSVGLVAGVNLTLGGNR
ncbi:MAG TPA: hypothetical protein VGA78_09585 [Gemmatimonadales bacterium]